MSTCAQCCVAFKPRRSTARYCGDACRKIANRSARSPTLTHGTAVFSVPPYGDSPKVAADVLPAFVTLKEPIPRGSISEEADAYPFVVADLDADTRVIECRVGIQWILQRRVRSSPKSWTGVSFCRTREALLRLAGQHPDLLALPESFDGTPVPAPAPTR